MTDITEIESAFRKSVGAQIELVAQGVDRYLVHTPFLFDDGDHYVVLLKLMPTGFVLSDEGHTFMHVSYDVPQFDQGTRGSIIDRVLTSYRIENDQGELLLTINDDRYGDALFSYVQAITRITDVSFVQAITRITDVSFLTRERVRSTFVEDFHELVRNAAADRQVAVDYAHPIHDPDKRYPIDARINGSAGKQELVFGMPNDNHCRDATVILNRWERWGESYTSIAVFQDQTEINRNVLARFSDVAERQFSSLHTALDRLPDYLKHHFS